MLILFDHGTPVGLARELTPHIVKTARSLGWDWLSNGNLLSAAEEAGFDLLFTTDQRIRYQQNLTGRKIAIIVLSGSAKWRQVRTEIKRIVLATHSAEPGSYSEVYIPLPAKARYRS